MTAFQPNVLAVVLFAGTGGGGINVLVDIIVCDLVLLYESSWFTGVIFSMFVVALSLCPIIGGLITQNASPGAGSPNSV
ncbi:hypothetical protein EYZ11_009654 [Aspergillus tanneri]|uniref:Major facilitator superfamily (MFS) profile domain-containing protein n=1 Tax=Aspergillus tanneri TaxID=1220188 RepID=A0A4V3UNE4_9EURO|nr:hypothetical protein EYZ11_009654 [Aspergillus tanneri]